MKRIKLGIIPARAGSKRIPNKNTQLVGGKPLVAWAIEAAIASKYVDLCVVSTDSAEVKDISTQYPQLMAIQRPAEISQDNSPAIDYVRHAVEFIESQSGHVVDLVVIIQPTSPFTRGVDIDKTIDLLRDSQYSSAVSVVELDHAIQPAKIKVMLADGRLNAYIEKENNRMAAHELPRLFIRNGSVYASKRSVIDEHKVIDENCVGYIMPRERSIDINDPMDLEFARFLYEKYERAGAST